ncbi:MAG: YfcE family phosphodiesterase [Eubacteriales bacterium]|nr:YfcE family phosphodiesterase [Eubacteriales bacterium]
MSEPVFFRGKSCFVLIADSHHNQAMLEKLSAEIQDAGGLILLGDCVQDAEYLRKKLPYPDVYAVKGNCDYFDRAPEEISGRLFRENGPVFLACHGHRWGVKMNPLSLLYHAKEQGAAAAFYGHTHFPAMDREEGVLLVNPGALKDGYYALVRFENSMLKVEHKKL